MLSLEQLDALPSGECKQQHCNPCPDCGEKVALFPAIKQALKEAAEREAAWKKFGEAVEQIPVKKLGESSWEEQWNAALTLRPKD